MNGNWIPLSYSGQPHGAIPLAFPPSSSLATRFDSTFRTNPASEHVLPLALLPPRARLRSVPQAGLLAQPPSGHSPCAFGHLDSVLPVVAGVNLLQQRFWSFGEYQNQLKHLVKAQRANPHLLSGSLCLCVHFRKYTSKSGNRSQVKASLNQSES